MTQGTCNCKVFSHIYNTLRLSGVYAIYISKWQTYSGILVFMKPVYGIFTYSTSLAQWEKCHLKLLCCSFMERGIAFIKYKLTFNWCEMVQFDHFIELWWTILALGMLMCFLKTNDAKIFVCFSLKLQRFFFKKRLISLWPGIKINFCKKFRLLF